MNKTTTIKLITKKTTITTTKNRREDRKRKQVYFVSNVFSRMLTLRQVWLLISNENDPVNLSKQLAKTISTARFSEHNVSSRVCEGEGGGGYAIYQKITWSDGTDISCVLCDSRKINAKYIYLVTRAIYDLWAACTAKSTGVHLPPPLMLV